MKKLLTSYLLKFLFTDYLDVKDGDILECQGDIFIFDDANGNPNNLKYFFKQNGFWNYVKAKEGTIFNVEKNRFLTKDELNSQGYRGCFYYKNMIEKATDANIQKLKSQTL